MKQGVSILFAVVLTVMIFTSCGGGSYQNEVQIGDQVWMTKNLDVSTFRNGDPIPHAKTDDEWRRAGENKQPAWCYNDNDPANGSMYGKLYNWYAVNDSRGLAPKGYHIPTDSEWTALTDYLGGESAAGIKMKSAIGWYDNGNGTNSIGFLGLPGGCRGDRGLGSPIGYEGLWWSSTEDYTSTAWYLHLYYFNGSVHRYVYLKECGLSVRCLKD
jgi:uncharacterized protein (TIGR02145 family)